MKLDFEKILTHFIYFSKHFDIKTGRKCSEHEGSEPVVKKRKLKYDLVSLEREGQLGKKNNNIQSSSARKRWFPCTKTNLDGSGDKSPESGK